MSKQLLCFGSYKQLLLVNKKRKAEKLKSKTAEGNRSNLLFSSMLFWLLHPSPYPPTPQCLSIIMFKETALESRSIVHGLSASNRNLESAHLLPPPIVPDFISFPLFLSSSLPFALARPLSSAS